MLMQPQSPTPPTQQGSWSFNPEGGGEQPQVFDPQDQELPQEQAAVEDVIQWTGSEFLEQHRSAGWYLSLFGILSVICGVIFIVSRDILSVVFIMVMGVLFAIIASRKPRQLFYEVSADGIHIGKRFYRYTDFKSFSLQQVGAIGYINLLPLGRFQPEISMYFPPEEGQKIFDLLSNRIPHVDHKETVVDRFAKFIRF